MSIPFLQATVNARPMDAIADGLSHGHTCAMPQIAQAELNTAAREAYPAGDSTLFWIWDFSKIVWSFPDFVFLFRFGEIFCGFQQSWWGFPHKSVNHCCVAYDSSAIRSAPRLLQNISKTPRNEIKMTKKMTKCEATCNDKMWSKMTEGKTLTARPSTRRGRLEADVVLQARQWARDDLRPSTWKKS